MARTPSNPRDAAEAAFRKATEPRRAADPRPAAVPGVKETVTLRIDQDVLHRFQDEGPGWQERVNAALRRAAGLD
jgi:uncharacterized protein (DUF4415 family)